MRTTALAIPDGDRGTNGNKLRLPKVRLEDLKTLSDEEVVRFANTNHRQFARTMRKAIVTHARMAGAALNEMKARMARRKERGWTDWLQANFDGSAETARLYMRIAANWDRIVAHGLDNVPELALTDLRWFLAEPQTKSEAESAPPDPEAGEDGPAVEATEAGGTPTAWEPVVPISEVAQYPVILSRDEVEEFRRMARGLKDALPADTEHDAIFRAVRERYEEVCRG